MNWRDITCFACLLIAGCTFQGAVSESEQALFAIEIKDASSEQAFKIAVTSQTNSPLCIASEGWPDSRGRVSEVFDVKLAHASGVIEADGYHPPLCVGGCEPIVIAPFERLDAKIMYSNFGDSEEIAILRGKVLKADVFAHACTSADFPIEIDQLNR